MAFRDGPFENIKVPLVWTAAVSVVACAVGAILLILGTVALAVPLLVSVLRMAHTLPGAFPPLSRPSARGRGP